MLLISLLFMGSQGEMRKLNREDKLRANELVREGGRKVQETLNGQHFYDWIVLSEQKQLYSPNCPIDGDVPIISLIKLRQ